MTHSQEGSPLSCLEGRALSEYFGVLGLVHPCFTMGMIIFQMESIAPSKNGGHGLQSLELIPILVGYQILDLSYGYQ